MTRLITRMKISKWNPVFATAFVGLMIWQASGCAAKDAETPGNEQASAQSAGSGSIAVSTDITGPAELYQYTQAFTNEYSRSELTAGPMPGEILGDLLRPYQDLSTRCLGMPEARRPRCIENRDFALLNVIVSNNSRFGSMSLLASFVDESDERLRNNAYDSFEARVAFQYARGILRNPDLLNRATQWAKPFFIRAMNRFTEPSAKAEMRNLFTHAIEYTQSLRDGGLERERAYLARSRYDFAFSNAEGEQNDYRRLEAFIFRRIHFDHLDMNWLIQTLQSTLAELQ